MSEESVIRRSFLFLGIALTLFGCLVAALGIALPAWQVVELQEFHALHEHGIFYDCVRSEITPLERIRGNNVNSVGNSGSSKKCTYKFDTSSTWTMRMAIEEGDPAAREQLFHRFLREFIRFYSFLIRFIRVYSCLFVFIRFYSLFIHFYSCIFVFVRVLLTFYSFLLTCGV